MAIYNPLTIEALSFLVLVARLIVMWKRVFILTLNTLLVYAWARSKPALMFSWRLHVNGPSIAPNTGYGSPCNTCTVTPGFWVMNAGHAAALGSLGLISSHNDASRWFRHNFDTSACCDGCNSISRILERLHRIRTEATSLPQDGRKCCVHHRVLCLSHTHLCHW